MRARRRIVWGLVILLVAAGIGWLVVRRARGPEVQVVRAHRQEVIETLVASGRILPPSRASLASPVLASVRAVHAVEGERVSQGQLLIELDDADARAAVERAEASVALARARIGQIRSTSSRVAASELARAEAALARAEDDLRRQEQLRSSGVVTDAQLQAARLAREQALAARESARFTSEGQSVRGSEGRTAAASLAQAGADLASARARLAQLRIASPVGGVVVTRDVEPGDVAQPGVPLMLVAAEGAARARIDPDESELARLALGQPALLSAEAFPDQRFAGSVSYLAPAIDPERGTIEVHLAVPDPPPYLRTDMTVSVEIETGRRAGVLALDAAAVRDVGAEPWVLVLEDGRTARRALRLGLIGEDRVEVASGLREGELVVPPTESVVAGSPARPRAGED